MEVFGKDYLYLWPDIWDDDLTQGFKNSGFKN